jgi:hypothetical protein
MLPLDMRGGPQVAFLSGFGLAQKLIIFEITSTRAPKDILFRSAYQKNALLKLSHDFLTDQLLPIIYSQVFWSSVKDI